MKLVIVAGFLGSGKTTVLLELAKALHERTGGGIAIIENEVGTVGIDDHLVRENHLPVKEIYSGCICCSLRIGLIETLLELEREYDPAVVLLEPSGVASPRQVLSALVGYGGEIESKVVLTLIDASRFIRLQTLKLPIITDGIQAADMLVLNKTDLVSLAELEDLEARLNQERDGVPIHRVCALRTESLLPVLAAISSMTETVEETRDEEQVSENLPQEPLPLVAACVRDLVFDKEIRPVELQAKILKLLAVLAADFRQAGCAMIGHIKAIIRPENGGYWFGSVTDFDTTPQGKGKLPGEIAAARLTVNAVVYGIEKEVLEAGIETRLTETPLGQEFSSRSQE